jgi:steroid delta-isomerase-like uncharacterized protein
MHVSLFTDNEKLVRAFWEEVPNKRNFDAIERYFADDYVNHGPSPRDSPDRETFKASLAATYAGFPDLHVTVEHCFAHGVYVTSHVTVTGTHTRPFNGIEPTNRSINVVGIHVHRLEKGKIVEHWGVVDELRLLMQLGAVREHRDPPA